MFCVRYDDGHSSESIDHCRDADKELRAFNIGGTWLFKSDKMLGSEKVTKKQIKKLKKHFQIFSKTVDKTAKIVSNFMIFIKNLKFIQKLSFSSLEIFKFQKFRFRLNEAWSEMGRARHSCYAASKINKIDREQKNIENHTFGKVVTEIL